METQQFCRDIQSGCWYEMIREHNPTFIKANRLYMTGIFREKLG